MMSAAVTVQAQRKSTPDHIAERATRATNRRLQRVFRCQSAATALSCGMITRKACDTRVEPPPNHVSYRDSAGLEEDGEEERAPQL